jgi:protein-tyrosine phosphatase
MAAQRAPCYESQPMLKIRPVLKLPAITTTLPHPPSHSTVLDLPTEIIPRLYISDIYAAESSNTLSTLGITHVLSAMSGTVVIPHHPSINHCKIPLVDTPFSELAAFLPTTTSFLRDALSDPQNRILVHCVMGVSRSASVIAAFLIAEYGWTAMQAVNHVKSKRIVAEPNPGFISQLREYAQTLTDA